MANNKTLLKILVIYTYLMCAATSLFFARSVARHYRQSHKAAAAPAAATPTEDGELPPREVNPLMGWNETTMVLPFMLLYVLAAFFLTTSPFPSTVVKKKVKAADKTGAAAAPAQQREPQVDHYNRRAFGTACVVVASFLFLVFTLSFFVQEKLEVQMFTGEDEYRRRERWQSRAGRDADAAAEDPLQQQQLEAHGGAGGEAAEGQCGAGGDMSHSQLILSSLDTLFDLLYAIFFNDKSEDDVGDYRAYKKSEEDQNSFFYNFASIQRAEVVLLHVAALCFSLYCLFAFDATELPPAAREREPQERRDNPALTMDALKQLGAGAAVPRAKKAELLEKDSAEAKKKQ